MPKHPRSNSSQASRAPKRQRTTTPTTSNNSSGTRQASVQTLDENSSGATSRYRRNPGSNESAPSAASAVSEGPPRPPPLRVTIRGQPPPPPLRVTIRGRPPQLREQQGEGRGKTGKGLGKGRKVAGKNVKNLAETHPVVLPSGVSTNATAPGENPSLHLNLLGEGSVDSHRQRKKLARFGEKTARNRHAVVAYNPYSDANGPIVLLTDRTGNVKGHAILGDNGPGVYLHKLYAEKKNVGRGSMLLEGVQDYARANGKDHILLSSLPAAEQFYKRHGYVDKGGTYFRREVTPAPGDRSNTRSRSTTNTSASTRREPELVLEPHPKGKHMKGKPKPKPRPSTSQDSVNKPQRRSPRRRG